MPALELGERFVSAPIEEAWRVLAAAREEAFAFEPSLRSDNRFDLRREGLVLFDLLPLLVVDGVCARDFGRGFPPGRA